MGEVVGVRGIDRFNTKMRLLVTRPEPDNARTAASLRTMGHDVMLSPMLRIETIADADLGPLPCAAILLTSANGARALAGHPRLPELKTLPVLAVGQTSADTARDAGFADVTSANGDAADLARLAAVRFPGSKIPLLHVAGLDRSGDLAGALSAQGIAVRIAVAYRAMAATDFPPDIRAALTRGTIDAVLHFSRRSVDAYLSCGRDLLRAAVAPAHYCLSSRAAEPLRDAGATRVFVAARPDEESLLALIT
jgi:uroporphyrinogen-III synthase